MNCYEKSKYNYWNNFIIYQVLNIYFFLKKFIFQIFNLKFQISKIFNLLKF
jgi:hypothetical protein